MFPLKVNQTLQLSRARNVIGEPVVGTVIAVSGDKHKIRWNDGAEDSHFTTDDLQYFLSANHIKIDPINVCTL